MNYYIEMIKDFVMSEIKEPTGHLLDDGEYVYACGLAFNRLTAKDRKNVADRKREILCEIRTFLLFSVEIKSLIQEYTNDMKQIADEDMHLYQMICEYQPKGETIDPVMEDVLQEALCQPIVVNRYERQDRYQKKVGLVSKTYKLNGQVVEAFANACKQRGVALGPTLTDLMLQFIRETEQECVGFKEG